MNCNNLQLTPFLNRYTAETQLEFPVFQVVNEDCITVTKAKLVSSCTVSSIKFKLKTKMAIESQIIRFFSTTDQLCCSSEKLISRMQKTEDTKPIQLLLRSTQTL